MERKKKTYENKRNTNYLLGKSLKIMNFNTKIMKVTKV